MCIKRIKTWFRPIKGVEVAPPEKPKLKEKRYVGRVVRTSRGGHNMPRYQPCPFCQADSKRREKTRGGAYYWCRKCKTSFLVIFPGVKRARS